MMKRTLYLLATAAAALSLLCVYLGYRVLDLSISLDHAHTGRRSADKEREVLQKLTLDLGKGTKRDAIEKMLAAYAQGHVVKAEGADTIFIDGVGLKFRDNELIGITFMSDGGREALAPSR